MERHDVGAFGDHGDIAVLGFGQHLGECRGEIVAAGHAGDRAVGRRETGRHEDDAADPERLEQHLGLPFVDIRQRLGVERVEERAGAHRDEAFLRGAELVGADALAAFRDDDQRAAVLEDVDRRHHALDGLIIGAVERISGGARDDGAELARHLDRDGVAHEIDRRRVARHDLAEAREDQVALLVEDRVEAVDPPADHAQDLQLLLVQRIAVEIAARRQRILHEARGMEGADRRVMRDAGRHDLAAAGPAGHEMRLDETGGDADVGLHEPAVDADGNATRRRLAQHYVIRVVARVVVHHRDVLQHPRVADQIGELVAEIGAVQAGRDENRDAAERDARAGQAGFRFCGNARTLCRRRQHFQGLLEWFGIPYMGPGLLGSAIGIDKSFQNKLINVATNQKKKSLTISKKEWDLANKSDLFSALINEIGFPFVVKSPHQGSSIGVAIVKKRSTEEFSKAMSQCFFETTISQKDWSKLTRRQKKNLMDKMLNLSEGIGFPVVLDRETIYHPTTLIKTLDNYLSTSEEAILSSYNSEDFVLIEEFIDGREFSIGIIQDDDLKAYALPPTEIYGNTEAFDFKSKYQTNTTKKRIPVDTNFTNLEKIESSALTAFEFTGMSVVCRIDGFLTPANEIILHDPNTLPGMSPTSLIFKQLIEIGISITQGITYLIRQSCIQRKRSGKHTHKYAALVERIDALMQASNAKAKKKVAIIFGENADDYSKAQLAFNQFAASEEYNGTCICAARNGNYYQIPINKMFKGDILEFGQSIGAPTHEFVQKLVTKTEKIRNFYAGEVDFKVKKIEKDHIQNDFDLLYSSQKENFIESI